MGSGHIPEENSSQQRPGALGPPVARGRGSRREWAEPYPAAGRGGRPRADRAPTTGFRRSPGGGQTAGAHAPLGPHAFCLIALSLSFSLFALFPGALQAESGVWIRAGAPGGPAASRAAWAPTHLRPQDRRRRCPLTSPAPPLAACLGSL